MIKEMLSVNKRISCDVSHDDNTWLKRPKLKVEEAFNWQISRGWELLVEVTCELSKEGSREINEQENEKESAFVWKIDLQSQNVDISW